MNDKNIEMIEVIDLGRKISLLLQNRFNQIKTAARLAEESELNESEVSRFRTRGDNRININKFNRLCNTYPQIPEQLWHQTFEIFAQEIGLSSFQKPALAMLPSNQSQIQLMGIDFQSRIKDRNILEKRFEIMKGYWEIFCHSISVTKKSHIIYNLIEIKKINENGYIECSASYGRFNYNGYCFFIAGSTYFILEEINLLNEIVFIITNSPDRNINPILNGILVGLTGGSFELVAIPSAARIALRHINSLDMVKEKYKIDNSNISIREMIEQIRENINSDITQLNDILPLIDNHVSQDAVPYALRAKLF